MELQREYLSKNHSKFLLKYHIILVCKYRRKALTGDIGVSMKHILLYTVGRGYFDIDKKPNVASTDDEDDELGDVFCYDEHRWNHHLLTMDHKWKRIGNIHADVTLLMEKKPKED